MPTGTDDMSSSESVPVLSRESGAARFFRLTLLPNHFPALHGLRVLAIVSVLQIHLSNGFVRAGILRNTPLVRTSMNIFFGMDLFFILSGFLIGTLLLNALEKNEKSSILRFYARRSFRTFPLYYVVLTVLAISYTLNVAQQENLILEYTYLANYGDPSNKTRVMSWGWSLCVEEHFYLAVPLLLSALILLKSHKSRISILAVLWLAGLAVRMVVFLGHDGPWSAETMFKEIYVRTHTRFDILIAGVALAYVQKHFKTRIENLLSNPWGKAAFVLVTLLSLFVLLARPRFFGTGLFFNVFAWGTLTSLMYFPLILLVINAKTWFSDFLSSRVFLPLATLGYGVYLVHVPVGLALSRLARPLQHSLALSNAGLWLLMLALLFAGSLICAYGLHLIVEKPALWLRDKLVP